MKDMNMQINLEGHQLDIWRSLRAQSLDFYLMAAFFLHNNLNGQTFVKSGQFFLIKDFFQITPVFIFLFRSYGLSVHFYFIVLNIVSYVLLFEYRRWTVSTMLFFAVSNLVPATPPPCKHKVPPLSPGEHLSQMLMDLCVH